jgi:hypothetical protein
MPIARAGQCSACDVNFSGTRGLALHQKKCKVYQERLRLLAVARGCHDYGGGYRGAGDVEQAQYAAFQHGIATVVRSLEAAVDEPQSLQVRTLECLGRGPRKHAEDNG